MEKIDKEFLQAVELLTKRIPFLILKPETQLFESMVPYLAQQLNYDLVKLSLFDLGPKVTTDSALYLLKEVLSLNTDKETLIWLRELAVVDDVNKYVADVIQLTQKPNFHIVFTAVESECHRLNVHIPILKWKAEYKGMETFPYTKLSIDNQASLIRAPQDLYFRTFVSIRNTLLQRYPNLPDIVLESKNGKASLSSLISIAQLAVRQGAPVAIFSQLGYAKHRQVVDTILEGWTKSHSICSVFSNNSYGKII